MQLLLALLALAYVAPSTEDSHWCYEIQAKEPNSHCSGPEQWTGDCKKNQQSPINIVTSKTKLNPSLTPFTFVGYDQKKKWEVKNNQHSVEMSLGEDIYIFGGELPTQYKAAQLHLHWSEESNKGSEHSIDGKHFAMEVRSPGTGSWAGFWVCTTLGRMGGPAPRKSCIRMCFLDACRA